MNGTGERASPVCRSGEIGRRDGLKNRCPARGVPVRVRPSAPVPALARPRCARGSDAEWCNGSTAAFGAVCLGSNPSSAATRFEASLSAAALEGSVFFGKRRRLRGAESRETSRPRGDVRETSGALIVATVEWANAAQGIPVGQTPHPALQNARFRRRRTNIIPNVVCPVASLAGPRAESAPVRRGRSQYRATSDPAHPRRVSRRPGPAARVLLVPFRPHGRVGRAFTKPPFEGHRLACAQ